MRFWKTYIKKERGQRPFAVAMLLTLLFELGFPSVSMALTSGPSQPEVQSFEPVGTSQMVDPFSGDFTYNIPLLDVDGYPVNISYHSGITMDQEASWTGLGWNINCGTINRGMRGIPDDFNGEQITKEFNMKPNRTFGLTLGGGVEFFGKDNVGKFTIGQGGIGADLTIRFNNYTGVGMDRSLSGHIPLGKAGQTPWSASLGLTSSSDNGLTIQPNVSFSANVKKEDDRNRKMGLSIGSSFNSRAGLQTLTIGSSFSGSSKQTKKDKSQVSGGGSIGASSTFNYGMPTYTPELNLPYSNFSISASFKFGPEASGVTPYGRVAGYYSSQTLITNTTSQPAFGYLNAEQGVSFPNAIMDFNREKDAPYSLSTPALAIPNFTYDVLSVTGQGIGGSYRPFRSDFGHVFDPYVSNPSNSGSIGIELGVGGIAKVGVDVTGSHVSSNSGSWSDASNQARANNSYTKTSADPTYEKFYYKEANEKSVDADPTFLQRTGGYYPKRYALNQVSQFNTKLSANYSNGTGASGIRNARERRTQNISQLTRSELNTYGLKVHPSLFTAPSHHIAEITSTTSEGNRYVYGIAAYNTKQEECTFAVGSDEFGSGGSIGNLDCFTGLIGYGSGDNSLSNKQGIDNYFSNTTMPAYSHSYFLTAVLSADYVDSDTSRGPSVNDLGTWTKFNYEKTDANYKWRIPFESFKANHNEGLKWTDQDDKASYVYGEKELWYLTSIETKNYVAVFTLENRNDGYGVLGKDGGRDNSHPVKRLNRISLYTRQNYEAHAANNAIPLNPIKEVHFKYDYSLCPGIPNSINGGGKLTLKEISFSYQGSEKARLSPYKFTYSSTNPSYNIKSYDRWGNYKPQPSGVSGSTGCAPGTTALSNAEFPYTEQDTTLQDQYASAWSLTAIKLPSGGSIQVDYESDDYAYVQNKRAGQMFKIVAVSNNTSSASPTSSITTSTLPSNSYLVVQLQSPITGTNPNQQFYDQYLDGLDFIYFRFLYHMRASTYEYVPGYIPKSKITDYGVYPGGTYGYIKFSDVSTNDNGGSNVNPITKAALQFGRLNEAKNMWQAPNVNSATGFGHQFLNSIVQGSFFNTIPDMILGPNEALYSKHNCAQDFYLNKSWVRLNNPNKRKLGGGCRVKKISVSDNWSAMTSTQMPSFSYGQEYFYKNEDGTSSGVASYEPQIGGDENSLHKPVFFDENKLLAPNDENYMEEPFGESFFPSPSVGYSRVTVRNLKYSGVSKHATGKIVHEFWTAKDFPTITSRTDLEAIREKTDPLSISSLLNINSRDYLTASQGFYVETNDMHGKPRGQKVYQENISTPISSIEYDYKKTPYGNGSFRLDNAAQVVDQKGVVSSNNIGVFFDFVSDFRQHRSTSTSVSVDFNNDIIYIIFGVAPFFTVWPSFSHDDTKFRSAVTTKVVQRFGLLNKTTAKDLGSTVETNNMAYDSESGEVLLTQTTTDYNDKIYTLNYPAYWFYDGMGPAYKNTGLTINSATFNSFGIATIQNADQYFAPGDEIELNTTSTQQKAWILNVSSNTIKAELKTGTAVNGTYKVKVIRSGRRNMQMEKMASITTLQNPLASIQNNLYEKVITASATEFNDQWNAFCDCLTNYTGPNFPASYVTGSKGNWRKKRAFVHLSGRTQSDYDNNTNTRVDGVYTSYNPLYRMQGGKWTFDETNWTFTSQVTKINPNGQELENQDALGRYSAAVYGYNQTLATGVGANMKYKELAFDNAEDYSIRSCGDDHFKFTGANIDSLQSHSGKKSIRVSSGSPLSMTKVLAASDCPTLQQNPCQFTITSFAQIIPPFLGNPGGGSTTTSFGGPGAAAPLTFSWVVLSGTPTNLAVMANSLVVSYVNGQPNPHWSIIVTATGANGCTYTFPLSN